MKQRCENPNAFRYPEYGGKGISFCERWRSFDAFLSDMGPRPNGHTLDRIDGTKGYSPENCRWATAREQSDNLRTNVYVPWRGEMVTVSTLARELGLKKNTLQYRLRKGWSEEAISSAADHGDRSRGLLPVKLGFGHPAPD